MNTTTDQDGNGIAERKEKVVQQRMSAILTTIFLARKELSYTKQGFYTAACIPEPVNDVDKLKQRLIKVLAGCVQQTVVDKATPTTERKKTLSGLVAV